MTMSDSNSRTKYVKAIHPFKPTHTDELCFQKGDNIQVTQMIDGGWWEGMLNGVTGWFPSNYVIEATAGADGNTQSINSGNVDLKSVTKESANRDLVLQSLHSSEKSFVTDMERLVQGFLKNLDAKSILPTSDSTVLLSSIEEIIVLHTGILRDLEAIFTLNTNGQRIGQLFLNLANQVLGFHKKYCSIHPKIAILLQGKRDEVNTVMECLGAQSPGSMTLTSYLSKPLRHLEKYSSIMQEIDRHSDENHIDRDDLLKAVSVYRDIYQTCNNTRRQKEMEQEILCSEIKGWEGETLSQLGDIQLLSHCRVVTLSPSMTSSSLSAADVAEKQDRLLLLCPGVLIFLSVSPRVSGYNFEGKLPAYGTIVSSVEDCDNFSNVFEILSSSTNSRLLVSCSSSQEKNKWLQLLRQPVKLGPVGVVSKNLQYNSNVLATSHSVFSTSHVQSPTTSLPSTSSIFNSGSIRSSIILNQIRPSSQTPVVVNSPQQFANAQSSSAGSTSSASSSYNPNVVTLSQSHFYLPSLINTQTPTVCQQVPQRGFISNLRPYPPLRPSVLIKDDGTRSPRSNRRIMGSSRKKPVDDTKVLQEDALMLRVIESYCTSAKNRHAVNSLDLSKIRLTQNEMQKEFWDAIFDGPQVLIAEEEKIILEEAKDNQIVVEEKTLVDTVYSLRDQVRELRQDQQLLRKELEAEKKARRNLEMFVRQSLKSSQQNASKPDPPAAQSSVPVSGVVNSSVSNQNCTFNGINNGSSE